MNEITNICSDCIGLSYCVCVNSQNQLKIDYAKFLLQGHAIDFSQYQAKVIRHEDGQSYTVEFSKLDGKYCIRAKIERKMNFMGWLSTEKATFELTTPFV